jgi:16S rRNA G966 N2-methylase RsmD
MKLFCGDCLDVLPTLPDASVDMVCADPPYGTTACQWDSVIPLEPMWEQLRRVIKPRGAIVMTASQPFTSALVMSNPTWFRYELIWEKAKAIGFLYATKRPMACHENILVFAQGWTAYNPQKSQGEPYCRGMRKTSDVPLLRNGSNVKGSFVQSEDGTRYPRSIVQTRNAEWDGRFHDTQKPIALMAYLIRTYTNEGDTVLDFCTGSGTTGVACVQTGRAFIGIEKDAGYFAVAQKRIAEAENATPLFAAVETRRPEPSLFGEQTESPG